MIEREAHDLLREILEVGSNDILTSSEIEWITDQIMASPLVRWSTTIEPDPIPDLEVIQTTVCNVCRGAGGDGCYQDPVHPGFWFCIVGPDSEVMTQMPDIDLEPLREPSALAMEHMARGFVDKEILKHQMGAPEIQPGHDHKTCPIADLQCLYQTPHPSHDWSSISHRWCCEGVPDELPF